MSMPNSKVLCTGCDYLGVVVHRPITLIYQFPDGSSFTSYRTFGWCNSCYAMRDVEIEFDANEIRQKIHVLSAKTKGFFYLFGDVLNRTLGGKSDELDELKNLQAALRIAIGRKSKPRCLHCEKEEVKTLGQVTHRCGGSLYMDKADPDGIRWSYKPEAIFLDIEGRIGQLKSPEGWAGHLGKHSLIEAVLDQGFFSGFLVHIPMTHKELEYLSNKTNFINKFLKIIELRIMHYDFDSPISDDAINENERIKASVSEAVRAALSSDTEPVSKWFKSQVRKT